MDEQVGTLSILFSDATEYLYDNFNMYSLQMGFLVVVNTDGSVDHYSADTIDNFTYTPKENN